MSTSQAEQFAATYTVAAQYTDPVSGVSATVFADAAGNRYLAIRGTEPTGSDLTADGLLAFGLPSNLNPQFTALKEQLDKWLKDPVVLKDQSFTVTGHSLGGYLAAAVAQSYTQVTNAYLYNAPGVAGLAGNLADALASALNLSSAPSGNIWNIRGSEGFPLIAGLGYQLGTPVSIQTEAADNPLNNHSIVGLTDALAVHAAFGALDPTLSVEAIGAIIEASTDQNTYTLEAALSALGGVFGFNFPQDETGRDALAELDPGIPANDSKWSAAA
jgi:pimeloyl-ACP methyl ester carboxylesterase